MSARYLWPDGEWRSIEGCTMPECRTHLLNWLKSTQRDKWANYCMRHWLESMGGLGAIW